MNILITGITGFAGSHLAECIISLYPEHQVFGTKRYRTKMDNISPSTLEDITWIDDCDLTDFKAVLKCIKASKPDRIFHLSAESFVPTSWSNPTKVVSNNVVSQINLFEAVREVFGKQDASKVRIQIAGSSEEYGLVHKHEVPITETNELRPLSPYAVSKIAQDFLGKQYYETYGMHIVRTRAFNHTGARRGDVFVCSTFAKQIVEIEKGLRSVLRVGNLEAVRDFTDVRDMVRAYWLALEKGEAGDVYNIGSGMGYTMEAILEILTEDFPYTIEQDVTRMRPSDVPILVCDATKFKDKTGWNTQIELKETLQWLLDYWRDKI